MCYFITEKIICVSCVWVCTLAISSGGQYSLNSNTNCLSMEYRFRSFTDTSLQKCAKNCAIRPMCQALNYHSTYQLCELLSQDFGEVSHHSPPCAMIKRSEIVISLPVECEQCEEGEMCDINELTESGTCVNNECKPLHLKNGHLFGNMYTFGSRVVYMCDDGYKRLTEEKFSVCQPGGKWSIIPQCEQVCEPITMTHALTSGNVTHTAYDCHEGYMRVTNEEFSICQDDGTWSPKPKCILECEPITLTHGHATGNSSHVVYECYDGFKRLTQENLVCQPGGNWSFTPKCIPDNPPLPVCPGIVLADGTIYPPPSTLNEEHFFEASCTPSSSYCHGDGTWESIPDCNQPVIALYLGCYLDCNDRILIPYLDQRDDATIENCIVTCSSHGYNFGYTEAGDWCHCGNEVQHFTRVDDAQCDRPCKGNSNQMCGGGWRASLYDLSVQTETYGRIHSVAKCTSSGDCIGHC